MNGHVVSLTFKYFINISYLLDFALQIQHPSVDLNIFGLVKVFIVKDIWISGESLENESTL